MTFQSHDTQTRFAVLEGLLDSESLFAGEVSPLNLAREEKRFFDQAFQTLQSEANLELATLLREVHISSDAPLGKRPAEPPEQRTSDARGSVCGGEALHATSRTQ